jgi:hypothetical protein
MSRGRVYSSMWKRVSVGKAFWELADELVREGTYEIE